MNADNKEEKQEEMESRLKRHRVLILALMGLVLTVILGMYVYSKPKSSSVSEAVEETYTLQTDAQLQEEKPRETKPAEIPEPQPVNAEQDEVALQQKIMLIQEKQKALQQRLSAPLMLVNEQARGESETAQTPQAASGDANTRFMNRLANQKIETAEAGHIGPLNAIIAEGSLIHAVLESTSNSDLPGYLRASVSVPVYSEDGSQMLIPRGSRLIGQYKSGMSQGQSRIFVVWTRLITPEGISVQLGSPGVDSLGMAGMEADEINRHFWERFGTASLLSLIGAGAANVGVNGEEQNPAASYREALAGSFAQSADQSLQDDSRIAPTLKTYQGKPIMVFVAKDINFQNAVKQTKPAVNVF